MDHCPGNTYRKVDNRTAEFAHHRLGNRYISHRITMGCTHVRKEPFNDLLDDPLPRPAFLPPLSCMSAKAFKKDCPCMVCDAPAPIARGICYTCQPQTNEELLG